MTQNQARLNLQIKIKETKTEVVGRNVAEITKEPDGVTATFRKL